MRNIYRKIAREHGVSVAQVKADMQTAINAAWNNPSKTPVQITAQNKYAPAGAAPTADEFIKAVSSDIKTKK